ncbi:MAG: glycine cleavage system aminomethyltransferase GcvT [Candidatus Omnitrophica bacterium]|nr:glycine cleavage system aminomethyltransferase GcvT [Candidatus Omnitrophota bacterium]
MTVSDSALKQTPLYKEHESLKAKIVPFGGWQMPLQYEGIIKEYTFARQEVVLFDTSHMGEFFIEGDLKGSGLDKIVTQSLKNMPVKTCRYGLMLKEEGGVIDDLIVYRIRNDKWMIVVNAGPKDNDVKHFQKHLNPEAKFCDVSSQTGKIDVQGPRSRDFLVDIIPDIRKLDYYAFDTFNVLGEDVIVSRTGYTGELGYEIYFPWNKTVELWQLLLTKGAQPAGLGVRDVLRIEVGYPLYGHEITESGSPLQAGLKKFIDWEKDFLGKQVLLREQEDGIKKKLINFVSENRRSPRAHYKIYSADKTEIGKVSSGTFAPYLKKGVGLGFIDKERGKIGNQVFFGEGRDFFAAEIVKRPIYDAGSLKK